MPAKIIRSQSNRPAAAVAISFAFGIGLSEICREYLFAGFAVAGFSLVCASLLSLRRNRPGLSFVLANAAVAVAGLLMALAHRDGIPDHDLRSLLSRSSFQLNEPIMFEGCVVDENEKGGQDSVTTVDFHGFLQNGRWIACKGKGILRTAALNSEDSPVPGETLMWGDRVRGWARWRIPHNYRNPGSADTAGRLARRGIFLVGRAKSPRLLEPIPGDCSNPLTAAAGFVRSRVRQNLHRIDTGNRQSSAILASLMIGDYSGLDNNTRELFQNAGAFHVLVVSGLHVAWIAGVLILLLRLIGIPERIRYLLASLAILFYATVTGFQASITRCLWMFILYLAGRMLTRRADPVNILFAAALLLLFLQPDRLFETGFQLSFLSVMAIAMTAVPAVEKYLRPIFEPLRQAGQPDRLFLEPGHWHRLGRNLRARCELLVEEITDRRSRGASGALMRILRFSGRAGLAVGSMFIVSLSVQIWLEPLLAYHFNRLSWIAPLANLVIVPLSSVVLSAGILSCLAMSIPFVGVPLLRLAGWLASVLVYATGSITTIGGAWQRCPTPSPIWVAAGILFLFCWSFFGLRRFWIPCVYIAALLAVLSAGWRPGLTRKEEAGWEKNSLLKITFLDVGEGDSAVIAFPNGRHWVIDAGGLRQAPAWEEDSHALDIGEAVVSRYLWHEWITKLDRLVLSHPDLDHAGGIPALIKNFRVGGFYHARSKDKVLGAILEVAHKRGVDTNPVHSGMELKMGEVTVRTFNPPAGSDLGSNNDNSIVLGIRYGRFSALFTGDLEKAGESEVLSHPYDLPGYLLKVAHHGSRSGTSEAFLNRTRSRWAVLSVGRNNQFGHPSPLVVSRLLKQGARPIMTFDQGAITFETDGTDYAVKSHVAGTISPRRPLIGETETVTRQGLR